MVKRIRTKKGTIDIYSLGKARREVALEEKGGLGTSLGRSGGIREQVTLIG